MTDLQNKFRSLPENILKLQNDIIDALHAVDVTQIQVPYERNGLSAPFQLSEDDPAPIIVSLAFHTLADGESSFPYALESYAELLTEHLFHDPKERLSLVEEEISGTLDIDLDAGVIHLNHYREYVAYTNKHESQSSIAEFVSKMRDAKTEDEKIIVRQIEKMATLKPIEKVLNAIENMGFSQLQGTYESVPGEGYQMKINLLRENDGVLIDVPDADTLRFFMQQEHEVFQESDAALVDSLHKLAYGIADCYDPSHKVQWGGRGSIMIDLPTHQVFVINENSERLREEIQDEFPIMVSHEDNKLGNARPRERG